MSRTAAQITEDIEGLTPAQSCMFLNLTPTHAHYLNSDEENTSYVETLADDFNGESEVSQASILSNVDDEISIIKPDKHPEGEPS